MTSNGQSERARSRFSSLTLSATYPICAYVLSGGVRWLGGVPQARDGQMCMEGRTYSAHVM